MAPASNFIENVLNFCQKEKRRRLIISIDNVNQRVAAMLKISIDVVKKLVS
jgi:hypothetical protein